MSTDNDRRSAVDYATQDQTKRDYWDRESEIETLIERCSRALARGRPQHYRYVATTLSEDVVPMLEEHTGKSILGFDDTLRGHEDWDYMAVSEFCDSRETFCSAFNGHYEDLSLGARDYAKDVVERALRAITAAAESEEVVLESYSAKADAVGFSTKTGEHLQSAKMDIGDPVQTITAASGAVKTLFSGGTGQGKSAALETETEDLYRMNFDDSSQEMKLIDIVGTGDGENWFYDIPQQDGELRHVRSELGLPETFADWDHDPEVEILVPLTPDLADRELPFDVARGEFIVRPYTVPASEIRKPLLVSMITTKLTDQQEQVVRDAYDEVDSRLDDWRLRDLADEIRSRDDLPSDKKQGPIRTLRHLQNQGFIRTKECEYTIDWRRIFESTERITVFSQSFIPNGDQIGRLINIGYVLHTILKKRESMPRLPKCALLMRELWTVAPHGNRRAFDARAAHLQEATAHVLGEILRVNRRRGIYVLADVQQISDLHKAIREMFNRYVVFRTNRDTVKDIFEWTSNNKWREFYGTLNAKPGHGSIVGMTKPAIDEREIEFIGPVKFSAPSHHHFDEDSDHTGWHSRARYLSPIEACPECESDDLKRSDGGYTVTCVVCGEERRDLSGGRCEELRKPADVESVSWPTELPPELQLGKRETESRGPNAVESPVAAFAEQCLEYDASTSVQRKRVYTAFNQWSYEHKERDDTQWDFNEQSITTRFGERLKKHFEPKELGHTTKYHESAWKNLRLTSRGLDFYDRAMEGFESSASPILE